jgi:hypothetical protein
MDRDCLFSVIGLGLFCAFNEDTTVVGIDTDHRTGQWLSLALSTVTLSTVREVSTDDANGVARTDCNGSNTCEAFIRLVEL